MRRAALALAVLALASGCGERQDAPPPPAPAGVEQAVTEAETLIRDLESELARDG